MLAARRFALVVVAGLCVPAPATASTLVGAPHPDFRFEGMVTYTAAPGEANRLQVSLDDSG